MSKFIIAVCWFGLIMTPFVFHVSTKVAVVESTPELIEFEE